MINISLIYHNEAYLLRTIYYILNKLFSILGKVYPYCNFLRLLEFWCTSIPGYWHQLFFRLHLYADTSTDVWIYRLHMFLSTNGKVNVIFHCTKNEVFH